MIVCGPRRHPILESMLMHMWTKLKCGFCVGLAVLLTACLQNQNPSTREVTSSDVPRSATGTILPPISSDETTSVNTTPMGTPTISAGVRAETMVADPGYMRECKATHLSVQSGQVGFHGIFPGRSTAADVEMLMGPAREHNSLKGIEEWVYTGFNIYFESNLVRSIEVYQEKEILKNLKELVARYGCPDLIFAFDMSIDQPSGAYGLTEFTYLTQGIRFMFLDFPVSLSSKPDSIDFITPHSSRDYLEQSDFFTYNLQSALPVSWSEAVR